MDYCTRTVPQLGYLLRLPERSARVRRSGESILRMLSLYKSQIDMNADAA